MQTQPLEIVEGTDAQHVVDQRGVLLSAFPTHAEAAAFVAGYRVGRTDAQGVVREVAQRLERVGRS